MPGSFQTPTVGFVDFAFVDIFARHDDTSEAATAMRLTIVN
jgi:hypothetical protein